MVMFSTVVSAHEYTVMFITLVNGLFDHLSGKMGINVRFKLYAIIAVLHLVYLAVFAYTRDQGASGIRQQSVDMHMRDRQQTFDRGTQLVQSLTGIGGDDERIWLQRGESFTSRLVRLIGLVEYENTRNRGRAFDVRQHVIDRVDLRERVRVGAIDHMQDHVGLGHLFQGGFERLDQLGGQAAHEADRVHVGVSASVAGFGAAHGWTMAER